MKVCYLDASAWVKRYYQEAGTEDVQALFVEGALFACASLGFIEVIATLSCKVKARQISLQQFQQKHSEAASDWSQFIQIQLSDEVLQTALQLTAKQALRGADAVHLASAAILKENLPKDGELILITADTELLAAAEHLKIVVFNPAASQQ